MSKNTTFKKCNIMGVNIDIFDMEKLINYTIKNLKVLNGKYICVCNVHTVVTAYENDEYRKVQDEAEINMPDGGPLVSEIRKRGCLEIQRTTGPSYMEEIFKISKEHGWKHYFYGSTQDTLNKLKANLISNYPDIKIVGMYSPPFRKLTEKENIEVINDINKTKPDFIWVGLGAPKQELWMYEHKGLFNGVMIGVGAGFDYLAGNIKRAPKWMQDNNLEWLYRLIQDPKGLFSRYMRTNSKYIWHALIRGK